MQRSIAYYTPIPTLLCKKIMNSFRSELIHYKFLKILLTNLESFLKFIEGFFAPFNLRCSLKVIIERSYPYMRADILDINA
jgi:hypothetical protein